MRPDAQQDRTHGAEETRRRRSLIVALAAAAVFAITPQTVAVARAVANLPTSAAAVVWAKAHDGHCVVHGDLTIACSRMSGGYTHAGVTVGNVWLYGDL
ncbi:MAG: hypothetical protein ACXV2I_05795, partial [Actinomycetes bacterium]